MKLRRHPPDVIPFGLQRRVAPGLRLCCAVAEQYQLVEGLGQEFLRRVGHPVAMLRLQVRRQRTLAQRQYEHAAWQVEEAGHEFEQPQQRPGSGHVDSLNQHHQRRLRDQSLQQLAHRGVELTHRRHARGAVLLLRRQLIQPVEQATGDFEYCRVALRQLL